ncbi:MAG: 30S ribosomal protein S6 [Clostridia bacterium]|nr:30S ribosomal protein S6 [Clostridia bacterium]
MAKITNLYECLFVVDVENETVMKATMDKFTTLIANNAEVVDIDEWGKRRLAYPINDKPEGYYVVVYFKSEPDFPAELERLLNIDENIMRSLTLKLNHEPKLRVKNSAPAEEEAEEEKEASAESAEAAAEEAEKAEDAAEEAAEAAEPAAEETTEAAEEADKAETAEA